MTASPVPASETQPPEHIDRNRQSNGFWGMAAFLATDVVMFTLLLVANIYLRRYSHGPGQASLDPGTTFWYSLGLWASSGVLILAERLRRQTELSGLLYLLTAGLGLVFVYGQVKEYLRLTHLGARVDVNLFYTGFYTVTGLHGLHVLVGALALIVAAVLRFGGRLGERRSGFTGGLGLYWHFVDGVWAVLFAVLYLWSGP
ncbi:heme-copper oxidase subunit III [Deinococcus irradiatisoli]|uniref:Heme-copper oxidase subunit III n=1 Tax=Deinococcus irradiatisoli TaxID=2202254 RepID=A0A2Z3JCK4_9DEIO|nr:cytochrome c oxidase subunit 3 [Deinococcus irradiatisoli]AWN22772.1 heme-copper oxidase subunit III [Deinococcus irradiatisoli]